MIQSLSRCTDVCGSRLNQSCMAVTGLVLRYKHTIHWAPVRRRSCLRQGLLDEQWAGSGLIFPVALTCAQSDAGLPCLPSQNQSEGARLMGSIQFTAWPEACHGARRSARSASPRSVRMSWPARAAASLDDRRHLGGHALTRRANTAQLPL